MIGLELRNRWTRSDECDRFSLTLPLPPTTVSHNTQQRDGRHLVLLGYITLHGFAGRPTRYRRPFAEAKHMQAVIIHPLEQVVSSEPSAPSAASIQPQSTPTRPSPSPACWYWFNICHTVSSKSPPKSHPKSLSVPVPTAPSISPPIAGGGAMPSCTAFRSL